MNFVTALFVLFSVQASQALASQGEYVLRPDQSFDLDEESVDKSSFKIMWWNIGCMLIKNQEDLSDDERLSIDPVHQWTNLRKIINSENLSPDLMILGEYCPSRFSDPTYREIRKIYKYKYRLDKSNPLYRIRNGLRVFSKFKIRNLKEGVLSSESFVDSEIMKNCDKSVRNKNPKSFALNPKYRSYWNRPKISFELKFKKKTYKIVPVHLANPWSILRACEGFFGVPALIRKDRTNANFIQAQQLIEEYSNQDSTVIIGDFNAPKSRIRSLTYDELEKHFGSSVVSSTKYTFSDPRRSFPALTIDHAFVSKDIDVKNAVVLPFAGSDHLPLFIVID